MKRLYLKLLAVFIAAGLGLALLLYQQNFLKNSFQTETAIKGSLQSIQHDLLLLQYLTLQTSYFLYFNNDTIFTKTHTIETTLQQLIKQYSLKYINKSYQYGDIDGFFLVIVATNDITLQKEIFNECETKKILCNSVDSTKYCSFIFPSFIKQGDLTISFSTSGISPSVSKYLKKLILEILPKDIDKFLITLKHLRNTLPKGKQRQKLLDDKAKKYILGDKND